MSNLVGIFLLHKRKSTSKPLCRKKNNRPRFINEAYTHVLTKINLCTFRCTTYKYRPIGQEILYVYNSVVQQ